MANLERLERAAAAVAGAEDGGGLSAATREALLAVLSATSAARARAADEADTAATGAALATEEDWAISQFWYSEATARELAALARGLAAEAAAEAAAAAAASGGDGGGRAAVVACLSCPSVYKALRALLAEEAAAAAAAGPAPPAARAPVRAHVLEFDRRFAIFGEDFSFFDYNTPLELPAALLGACDVVVLDPPFLNRDCLAAFASSVAALRRPAGGATRVVLCTGAVMLRAARELLGARPTRAEVRHESGRLSNPFSVFVDFPVSDAHPFLRGVDEEAERAANASDT